MLEKEYKMGVLFCDEWKFFAIKILVFINGAIARSQAHAHAHHFVNVSALKQ